MGNVRPPLKVKLFVGLLMAEEALSAAVCGRLQELFGPIEDESDLLAFDFTDYYTAEMGEHLQRKFVSFAGLVDPEILAQVKVRTNALERDLARTEDSGARRRRVNLDPGYVTASKVVLATTKDFSHRVYLRDGIYAEVTMNFTKQGVRVFPWTYPDFQTPAYVAFLRRLRARVMAAPTDHSPRTSVLG